MDREAEMDALLDFVRKTVQGQGVVAAVSASAGMGKSAMLRALAATWKGSGRARARFILVNCYGDIGAANAYGPFLELLRVLHARGRRRRRLLRIGTRAVTGSTPELLGLVPAVGPMLRVGAMATKAAMEGGTWDALDEVPSASKVRQAIAAAVTESVRPQHPAIVIIDDAHRIDASSCLVLATIAEGIGSLPLGFILAYRPEAVGPDHPLQQLLSDVDVRGALVRLSISGFSHAALRDYLRSRFAFVASDSVIRWLQRLTGGHPIFLAQYLTLLDERGLVESVMAMVDAQEPGVGAAASSRALHEPFLLPTSVEVVMRERIRHIDEATKQLLLVGATQGEWFMSAVLEHVCGMPHGEVIERLHAASRDFGVIQAVAAPGWVQQTGSDFYKFEHTLMRLAFYQDQSPQARRERHVAVATELERMAASVPSVPQEIVLDIASHYHLGGAMMLAAERTLAMARQLASEAGSYAEATSLCHRALDDIRSVSPTTRDADGVHVQIIELLLVITMLRWHGRPELQGDLALNELAAEATAAAARSGDPDLRARALFMEGRILLRTHGPKQALPQLRAAADLARHGRNPVTRFVATAEYGHHLAKQDLKSGMQVLTSAENMYKALPPATTNDPVVTNLYDEVETQLAINYFDVGDFDEALRRLGVCIDSLRSRGRLDELSGALNYLAQVQIALGQQMEAVTTLVEGIACGELSHLKTGWHAWNLGLLGRAEAEMGHVSAARALVEGAWAHAQRNWIINIVPVVRVYYAEVMLTTGATDRLSLERAESMVKAALEESRQAGLPRSEVNALSLLGRIHLVRGDIQSAVAASQDAVALLTRVGPMSTVRTEEVLYHHAVAVRRLGEERLAREALVAAWELVTEKAATIGDGALREHFVERGSLNRAIRQALGTGGSGESSF